MNLELINIIIHEIIAELKEKFPDFRGIYLFGSFARGNPNPNSDCDIALLFDRQVDWKFKNTLSRLIFNYMIKYDIIIDSHYYNYYEIINPVTPFRQNVKIEGIFYEN